MNKTMRYCILVTVLMLIAVCLVFFGKNVINTGMGFTLSYKYLDGFLQKEGSSFRKETVLWLRVLVVTGILAAVLVWLRKKWSTIVTLLLCLCSVIVKSYGNLKHGYGIIAFDDTAASLMHILPLIAAVLCILLLRELNEDR